MARKEEYTVRKFIGGKQVKELTDEQKKQMTLAVIRALGGRVIENK